MTVRVGDLTGFVDRLVGDPKTEVIGVTHDSRLVAPGWLFCAVPGDTFDGARFVGQAVAAGASALMVQQEAGSGVAELVAESVRTAMGPVSSEVYGNPTRQLSVIGVTGTNGKTTVTELLSTIANNCGHSSETIGTLTGERTTPEAPELQSRLAEMVDRGVEIVPLEVSSHALVLGRVNGCRFRVGVFTNLGRDHLDFHTTQEDYFAAKARLFSSDFIDTAVICRDDEFGRRLIDGVSAPTHSYGLDDAVDLVQDGTHTRFVWRGHQVSLPLVGHHNVLNALAAATAAALVGIEESQIASALGRARPPSGRFEFVEVDAPYSVVVDYAHTPDALRVALLAARQFLVGAQGPTPRVILVFGCGGDRDREKRPEMAREAEALADLVILTSDNPRTEDPDAIIAESLAGLSSEANVTVQVDRELAIRTAVDMALPGDIVLIAGKGHETYQVIGTESRPFDDRLVAAKAVADSIETGENRKIET